MDASTVLGWLLPYRFSWLAATVFPTVLVCYAVGHRRLAERGQAPGFWRTLAFYVGVLASYAALHTYFDYLGNYLFFMHRAQHLVLHHLSPLLIALAHPVPTLAAGLPRRLRLDSAPLRYLAKLIHLLQQPAIASLLFVGLIYFWLWPAVHFDAMLSEPLYLLMNWSMLLDGLLFWMVLLDPRPPRIAGTPGYGARLGMIWFTMVVQIVLGAYITFSHSNLYSVYAVCGRAWPISSMTDQTIGGLLTWIPPAMMEVVAALVVVRMLTRHNTATGSAVPVRA